MAPVHRHNQSQGSKADGEHRLRALVVWSDDAVPNVNEA
jgi:hypothetical protein